MEPASVSSAHGKECSRTRQNFPAALRFLLFHLGLRAATRPTPNVSLVFTPHAVAFRTTGLSMVKPRRCRVDCGERLSLNFHCGVMHVERVDGFPWQHPACFALADRTLLPLRLGRERAAIRRVLLVAFYCGLVMRAPDAPVAGTGVRLGSAGVAPPSRSGCCRSSRRS